MNFYDINLVDLQVFQELYRQRSISKTAKELFTSRQSVARSIQNIENIMQHELFVRSPQGTFPTDYANELIKHVQPLLDAAGDMIRFNEEYDRSSAPVSLGLLGQYQTGQFLEDAISVFVERYPELSVNVFHYDWPDILDALDEKKLDFAYTALVPQYNRPNHRSIQLFSDDFVVVVPKGGELDCAGSVGPEILDKYQPVLYSRYNIQVGMVNDYAREQGVSMTEPVTTSDYLLLSDYIGRENYVLILLRYVAERLAEGRDDLRLLPLSPPLQRRSGLIYRSDLFLSENHRRFIKLLKGAFRRR